MTMHRTVFDIPALLAILRTISRTFFRIVGWRTVDERRNERKYLMIIAPHTSNWDFPVMFMFALARGFHGYWMGKHTLFKGPLGPISRWLGGLPIDRSMSLNRVDQTIAYYKDSDNMVMAITPEGTRKRVDRWRSGFYHIAMGASVPIALGYADYRRKECGIGRMFFPTGDYERDLAEIKDFYRDMTGKHPENYNPD